MTGVLARWNKLPPGEAADEILSCCGSLAWADGLSARRPFETEPSLLEASDEVWTRLARHDWIEAFSKHPRIGERRAPEVATAQSALWSTEEQQSVAQAQETVRLALAQANREYEQRFGRVFIICATGRSAAEMLEIVRRRLRNDDATELRESAEEQRRITNLRLRKWLSQ
jgi:2-oxo-4-hydroxy-4-carboxy-5-ureidoimidazoline decarboxylase